MQYQVLTECFSSYIAFPFGFTGHKMGASCFLLLCIIATLSSAVIAYMPRACVTMTSSRLPEPTYSNAKLEGHVFLRVEVAGAYWCARRCLQQHRCQSFNFYPGSDVCQLNEASAENHESQMMSAEGVVYYDRDVIPEVILQQRMV